MPWKRLLAYITGTVDEEILLRNEYLATEKKLVKLPARSPNLNAVAERWVRHENCARDAPIHCRERLGGLLKYYYPEAG